MRSTGFDPISIEIFNARLRKVTILVIGVFAVLVLRLWFIQVAQGPSYRIKSEDNRIHLQDIPPFRGMILDRKGGLLVSNRPSYNLYVIPEGIQDRDQLLASLSMLIPLDPKLAAGKLNKSLHKNPFNPILLKRDISRRELAAVETNLFNLSGVMIQVEPQRYYVHGRFASHLIGYLGQISERQLVSGDYPDNKPGDLIGKYGVEGRWQGHLNGFRGGERVEVDAAGRKLRVVSRKPSVSGLNVCLTIDPDLQKSAEKGLENKQGAIVAMNPNNGQILAMASSPAFDPNMFVGGIDRAEWLKISTSKDSPLQNRAISGLYPPGSVFKIVVALAGLEEGVIDPQEEINCTGTYPMGDHVYRCWKEYGHGKVSFHRALVESCDTYFYVIGARLGVDKIARYARMLGLGRKTEFGLDYEREGLIPTRQWKLKKWGAPWQAGETLSVAIGQSYLLVTPLQMARMISAIFNGGRLYQPKVVTWAGKDGNRAYEFAPAPTDRIRAKAKHIELIKRALIGAVNEPRGTGSRAEVEGILVAGKTGTAQVIRVEKEENSNKEAEVPPELRDHAWFVAIAPARRPTLAIAILIEHGGHGGSAAAPIAKEMIKVYFAEKARPERRRLMIDD